MLYLHIVHYTVHLSLISINTALIPKYCDTTGSVSLNSPSSTSSPRLSLQQLDSCATMATLALQHDMQQAIVSTLMAPMESSYPDASVDDFPCRFNQWDASAPRPAYSRFFHSTRLSRRSSCHCSRCYHLDMGFGR